MVSLMKKRGISPQQAMNVRNQNGQGATRLQEIRVKKGMSQNDLSNASGVPKRTIQCYEQKQPQVDNAKLNTLCDLSLALDCNVGDILEDKELIKKLKATTKNRQPKSTTP